jgi:hypothetical protein
LWQLTAQAVLASALDEVDASGFSSATSSLQAIATTTGARINRAISE